ncbi:hypothetical protein BDV95DRAFT_603439 [Massariosphaeria phaeospora]|uniref:Uncharacterized protein n=1 Tax=Massariosphaeria phaeospora TaxID=100035 RepID=A0A7C8ME84_9PLEO|nr:hypothetical protein BDV95DRAFT_603439 [Massariosphaeria phaeospora]
MKPIQRDCQDPLQVFVPRSEYFNFHECSFPKPPKFIEYGLGLPRIWGQYLSIIGYDFSRAVDMPGQLLSLCKFVSTEAAEVLYGENDFRFDTVVAQYFAALFLKRIGPNHFAWLKVLTISIPLVDVESDLLKDESWPVLSSSRRLVNCLVVARDLRQLNFVIPFDWAYDPEVDDNPTDNERYAEVLNMDSWVDLNRLMRARRQLHVVVVRLQSVHLPTLPNIPYCQARLVKALRSRLGLWDFRLATLDIGGYWKFPEPIGAEDPDHYYKDIGSLFAEDG